MTPYALTQTTINGPYVPTNLTLKECWESDLGQDVDYALLRDNATPDELEILEAAIKDNSIDVEPIEQAITARVLAAGRYVHDSKWTREAEDRPTVQMIDADRAAEGYIEYRGDAEDKGEWLDVLSDYDVIHVSNAVMGWGEYAHMVKLLPRYEQDPEDHPLYYLIPDSTHRQLTHLYTTED